MKKIKNTIIDDGKKSRGKDGLQSRERGVHVTVFTNYETKPKD